MKHTYIPQGVCSRMMTVEIENGIIKDCEIIGGCAGNTTGICSLIKGMDAEDAMDKLKGIDCRGRGTSCPDQLANCIEEALELS
ncbi:MAG: TIGR03905 family TSCPD domain-containing protein [Ruminococcus sp.]